MCHPQPVGAVAIDPDGVPVKAVPDDLPVGNILQQQTVGIAAPVSLKQIVFHDDVFGKHDRHPCAVIPEDIPPVIVMVGKHEMKPVPEIPFTGIAVDAAVFDKFQVDAIAVLQAGIPFYGNILRIPYVNGIPGGKLVLRQAFYIITPDHAVAGIFQVNAKESVDQPVILNDAMRALIHPDARQVFHKAHPAVLDMEAGNPDAVGNYRENLILPVAVDHRETDPFQVQLFIDDDIALLVESR